MKKRLLSCLLAAIMLLSLGGVTVYADDSGTVTYDNNTDGEGLAQDATQFSTSGDNKSTVDEYYTVTKDAGTDDGTLDYYVEITWTRTAGSATIKGDTYHWDASKQMYERTTVENALSSNNAATVEFTVKNYSNAKVNYEITYATASDFNTVEAADGDYAKTGTLNNYITYNDANGTTIANEGIENGTGDTGTTNTETGAESYTHTHTAPSATYKGTVTLNANSNTAAAFENQVVGTYTINITAAAITKQTVSKLVDSTEDTVLTAVPNPAEDNAKSTTVTLPKEVAALENGSTAKLTADATPILDSVGNTNFTVTGASNVALGAIDLTLNVTKTDTETGAVTTETVTEFRDADGNSVPVTVETYVVKGIEDFGFNYNGDPFTVQTNESDVDEAGEVWYDSTTGKLVFCTDHFSTYVLQGSNTAYIEDNDTVYATFADAYEAVTEGQTIKLIKDDTLSAAQGNLGYTIDKSFTLDLYGNELTSGIRTGSVEADPNYYVNMKIIDSKGTGTFVKDSVAGYNIFLAKPGMVIEGGTFTTTEAHAVIIDQIQGSESVLNNTCVTINGGTFANNHTYDSTSGSGTCIQNVIGKMTINGGSFSTKAGQHGSVIVVDSGNSYADSVVVINGGTFEGEFMFDMYSTGTKEMKSIVNVYGGTFNLENTVYAELVFENDVIEGTDYEVNIYGGTFNVDPSDYVASGYQAADNGNGTWTVSAAS